MAPISSGQVPQTEQPINSPELLAYFRQRLQRTAEDFALPPVSPEPLVLIERPGGPPERRPLASSPPGCLIFIASPNHFSCARYELAHEATHETLSHGTTTLDWVQEMFAEYIALKAVHELEESTPKEFAGQYGAYAKAREEEHRRNAPCLPLQTLRKTDLAVEYPDCTYARAFVTAEGLVDAIGWDALSSLGSMFNAAHKHDIAAWLRSLNSGPREAATLILDAT